MSNKYNHSSLLKFEGFRSFLECAENETTPQFVTERTICVSITLPGDSLDINASFLDTGATFPDVLGWLFHLLNEGNSKLQKRVTLIDVETTYN